jgi:hypothetical protein
VAQIAVVKGHRISPDTIRLDQPLPTEIVEVQVVLDGTPSSTTDSPGLSAFLRSLPTGNRSKNDIDHQVSEERDSWQR